MRDTSLNKKHQQGAQKLPEQAVSVFISSFNHSLKILEPIDFMYDSTNLERFRNITP
jgi:hypothetical protein